MQSKPDKPSIEEGELPPIPNKRYFAIGEVSDLCLVKPHVLRYWEQEFSQLRPVKRRGNRRYYRPQDVEMVRRIRDLLYQQGFTIAGARQQLNGRRDDEPVTDEDTLRDMRRELEEILELLGPDPQA